MSDDFAKHGTLICSCGMCLRVSVDGRAIPNFASHVLAWLRVHSGGEETGHMLDFGEYLALDRIVSARGPTGGDR